METLFQLSRVYFGVRAALSQVVESPFVRFAALVLLTLVAWRLLSVPQTTDAVADTARATTPPAASKSAPAPTPAPSAAQATPQAAPASPPAASAPSPAPTPTPTEAKGPFDTDLVAWWVVSAAAPGASGKVDALEHLHRAGKTFVGLDLSCRRMNSLPTVDVNCANGAFLKGVDLGPVQDRAVELSKSDLSGANLETAKLTKGVLRNATLARAALSKSDLSEADLTSADLTSATLAGAALERAKLVDAKLDNARLHGAKLHNADLTRAKLVGADLSNVDLTGADLSGADLTGTRLAGAKLGAALFTTTTLTGTEVSEADFGEVRDLDTVYATDVWAWADKPPKNLPDPLPKGFKIIACSPGEDDQARRAYRNAVKTGQIARGKPPSC